MDVHKAYIKVPVKAHGFYTVASGNRVWRVGSELEIAVISVGWRTLVALPALLFELRPCRSRVTITSV